MVTPEAIARRLLLALPGAHVEIEDMTGTRDHYEATVIAPQFAGKSRIDQHRMVYAALGELMGDAIHALKLSTRDA